MVWLWLLRNCAKVEKMWGEIKQMQAKVVSKEDILRVAEELASQGLRLATATCLDQGDHFEVIYHFQQGHETENVRVMVGKDEELPSISGAMFSAVLIENEISEFFGLRITGMAIDYHGHMLLGEESPVAPLLRS